MFSGSSTGNAVSDKELLVHHFPAHHSSSLHKAVSVTMTRPDGYSPTGTRPRDEDGNDELDEAEAQPQSPKRSKRSGVKHISRACDSCKSR